MREGQPRLWVSVDDTTTPINLTVTLVAPESDLAGLSLGQFVDVIDLPGDRPYAVFIEPDTEVRVEEHHKHAVAAADVSYDNDSSGLTAENVQAAIDELSSLTEPPTLIVVDLAGASTANFPSSAGKRDMYVIVNAHADGTTLGSSNQEVVFTGDVLLCLVDGASATDGDDWHVLAANKVLSVAARRGAVVLVADDLGSGTLDGGAP